MGLFAQFLVIHPKSQQGEITPQHSIPSRQKKIALDPVINLRVETPLKSQSALQQRRIPETL